MSNEDKFSLGFIAEYVGPNNAFYGGLLITNECGLPREFRHTEAVKPTRIQQILYGEALLESIGTDAIGPALLSQLVMKPTLLLIDTSSRKIFGTFCANYPRVALLVASPTTEKIFMESIAPGEELLDAEQLNNYGVEGSYIFAYIKENGSEQIARRALESAQNRMNLLSPFQRVRTVLQHIAEQSRAR